ncbi:2-dehydropantoate 2-reductase (Ketopantoate reductase) (KPA reductase) (KPR) [Tulasnella sp. 427]|nr:2-dehydropantoate 2-reductase (Ketopantoate reductase) (KPA reductase) (KPR) [Tulasnella sp. 427]
MRFHICGGGSIGSMLGWHMQQALSPQDALSIIVKPYQLKQIKFPRSPSIALRKPQEAPGIVGGFQVELLDERLKDVPDIAVQKALKESQRQDIVTHPPYGHISSLFVTTKAHAATPAMDALVRANRISPSTTVVLLTNGMGVYEHVVDTLFKDPATRPNFILATNTHGASLQGWFDVIHAAKGRIHYAVVPDPLGRNQHLHQASEVTKRATSPWPVLFRPESDPFYSLHRTVSLLDSLSFRLNIRREPIQHLHHRLVLKLITNCCINPLTALKSCKNGELLKDDEAMKTIRLVCEEATQVLDRKFVEDEKQAVTLAQSSLAGDSLQLLRAPSAEELEAEVIRVARLTAENWSSMQQDVYKKKPTEIEFLNGHLTRLGQLYGVSTPVNDELAERIRQLSSNVMPGS